MSATRWQRLETLFDEGIELEGAARAAWLAALDIDDGLRRELVAMLDADVSTGGLTARLGAAVSDATELPLSGQRLGPYRLVSELGAGGMGLVFLAERADEQFRQQVAIKLIRGLASSQAAEQLRHERQLLAELDHPNIARLLDGGETPQGQPYLVMEYVRGEPVAAAARARKLDLPARLRLVRDLAFAVHYAHQRLIVHRDIKPANVLLRDDGRPMLLDFGIAKLVDPNNLGSGLTQQWFTPAYASPEQRRGKPVSTATDIYALGLLLFELLTDTMPEPSPEGDLRAPSALVPAAQRRALRGDLDRIVLRATAAEPQARYASAEALAQDIERHLDGRPILAAPDSVRYRVGKFLRRHPFGVAAAGVAVLLLAGFAWRLVEERDRALLAEARAQEQTRTAEATTAFVANLFSAADPSQNLRGARLSPVELIDLGRTRLAESLQVPPQQRAELLSTLGEIYSGLGLQEKAAEVLEESLTLVPPEQPMIRGRILVRLGTAYEGRQLLDQASTAYEEAIALLRTLGPSDELADGLASLGLTYSRNDRDAEAETYLRESLAMRPLVEDGPSVELYNTRIYLGEALHSAGRPEEGLQEMEAGIAGLRSLLAADHPDLVDALGFYANALGRSGNYAAAEALYREMLAQRSTTFEGASQKLAVAHSGLGEMFYQQGRTQEAAKHFQAALDNSEQALGADDPSLNVDRNNLASVYEMIGDYAASEALFRKAMESIETSPDQVPQFVAQLRQNFGRTLLLGGKRDEAHALLSFPVDTRDDPGYAMQRGRQRLHLAEWERRWGSRERARALLDETDALADDIGGRESARYGQLLRTRGLVARDDGDLAAADIDLQRGRALVVDNIGDTFIGLADFDLDLADVALRRGDRTQARARLASARAILDPVLVAGAPQRTRLAELDAQLVAAR